MTVFYVTPFSVPPPPLMRACNPAITSHKSLKPI